MKAEMLADKDAINNVRNSHNIQECSKLDKTKNECNAGHLFFIQTSACGVITFTLFFRFFSLHSGFNRFTINEFFIFIKLRSFH